MNVSSQDGKSKKNVTFIPQLSWLIIQGHVRCVCKFIGWLTGFWINSVMGMQWGIWKQLAACGKINFKRLLICSLSSAVANFMGTGWGWHWQEVRQGSYWLLVSEGVPNTLESWSSCLEVVTSRAAWPERARSHPCAFFVRKPPGFWVPDPWATSYLHLSLALLYQYWKHQNWHQCSDKGVFLL